MATLAANRLFDTDTQRSPRLLALRLFVRRSTSTLDLMNAAALVPTHKLDLERGEAAVAAQAH
jgi:hypothetical protein